MIHSVTVLAAAGGESAVAGPGPGGIVIIGFLFVVLILALLAAVTAAMGAWFTKQAANSASRAAIAAESAAEALAKAAVQASVAAGKTNNSDAQHDIEDNPALMAVIAAAVHTVFADRPHRVVSVRASGPGWAQEGRRQIFTSHRVR